MMVLLLSGAAVAGGRGGGGRVGGGGGGRVYVGGGGGGRVVVHHTPVARVGGPVYVGGRTVVRERYYDQGRRPGMIVENYGRRPGYYWTPGQWQWDGREWIWYPGRYDPDPAYAQGRVYNGGY